MSEIDALQAKELVAKLRLRSVTPAEKYSDVASAQRPAFEIGRIFEGATAGRASSGEIVTGLRHAAGSPLACESINGNHFDNVIR
jgi:hypothetical protein